MLRPTTTTVCSHARASSATDIAATGTGSSPGLTGREEELLGLLCSGLRNAETASRLHIGEHTVEFHVRNIRDKLGARTRVEVVACAIAIGLYQ